MSRHSRQILLPGIGPDGQRRLSEARVLVVGAGGLGCPAALYLAAAGVGKITLVDPDRVALDNLHRQILFDTREIGLPKAERAALRLRSLDPGLQIESVTLPFDTANALELAHAHDLVLDATDNFATRYLVNDACHLTGRPNVFASVSRFEGRVAIFCAPGGPCYRCLYPSPPRTAVPSCAEEGVLGAVTGIVGSLQALEAIRWITGDCAGAGKLVVWDALAGTASRIAVPRDPRCPLCGESPSVHALVGTAPAPCGDIEQIGPDELRRWLKDPEPPLVVDVRRPDEMAQGMIPGAVILASLDEQPPTNPRIVVYCRGGTRGPKAVAALAARGLAAVNLRGGITAWDASASEADRVPSSRTPWMSLANPPSPVP